MIINNCGRLNLTTGKNLHFNLKDWYGEEGARLNLVDMDDGSLRVVGGWGSYTVGTTVTLRSSAPHNRVLGRGRVAMVVMVTPAGFASLRNVLGKNTVQFGTLD